MEESLKRKLIPETLNEAIDQFEQSVGLPKNFYQTLIEQDDWSFIIKTHALLETLLSQVISTAVGKPELEKILCKLNFANSSTGKIAFAKELGLIGKPEIDYLNTLTKIRNNYVHKISSVTSSLALIVSKLPLSEKLAIIKMSIPNITPETEAAFSKLLEIDPKVVIFLASFGILLNVLAEKGKRALEKEMANLDNQIAEEAIRIVNALGIPKLGEIITK